MKEQSCSWQYWWPLVHWRRPECCSLSTLGQLGFEPIIPTNDKAGHSREDHPDLARAPAIEQAPWHCSTPGWHTELRLSYIVRSTGLGHGTGTLAKSRELFTRRWKRTPGCAANIFSTGLATETSTCDDRSIYCWRKKTGPGVSWRPAIENMPVILTARGPCLASNSDPIAIVSPLGAVAWAEVYRAHDISSARCRHQDNCS